MKYLDKRIAFTLLMHVTPMALKFGKGLGRTLKFVGRIIVAGRQRSQTLARIYISRALAIHRRRCNPRGWGSFGGSQIHEHVGDLTQINWNKFGRLLRASVPKW